MWHKLKQLLCRHEWRVSMFQALSRGSTSYRCIKCGKYHHG